MKVRLTGTGTRSAGRLEVFKACIWAAISAHGVTDKSAVAALVCSQLGYQRFTTDSFSSFHSREQNVQWDSLSCNGSETSVLDCEYGSWTAEEAELGIACFSASGTLP